MRRPAWVAGVTLVPLSGSRLYVAGDPELAHTLHGADSQVQGWLEQLDGQREWMHQIEEARARGVDRAVATRLLWDLWFAELLIDVASHVNEPTLRGTVVFGSGVLCDEVRRLLPDSRWGGPLPRPRVAADWDGIAERADRAVGDSRLAVLALDRPVAESIEVGFAQRLLSAGATQLIVGAGTRVARVGPLTVPDQSACLRCDDLGRTDLDPDWPSVARQLAVAQRPPVDRLIAAVAAAESVRQFRAHVIWAACLDGSRPPAAAVGGVLEVGHRDGAWRRRSLPRHRECGCWWAA